MQLQACAEIQVFRAPVDFLDGVRPERVNRAETDQSLGVLCYLDAHPVIIFADGFTLVWIAGLCGFAREYAVERTTASRMFAASISEMSSSAVTPFHPGMEMGPANGLYRCW